jgi:murein hydrolase activator
MKRIFLLLIACCFLSTISAQSTRKIRELEAKRKELHQQIAESETLLQSTKKDVKSQLDNLALLTGQILSVEGIIMEEISETGTTENSSVSKQAARNRKVIKYRKRTYLFHLPNHNSGLSLAVSLRS